MPRNQINQCSDYPEGPQNHYQQETSDEDIGLPLLLRSRARDPEDRDEGFGKPGQ